MLLLNHLSAAASRCIKKSVINYNYYKGIQSIAIKLSYSTELCIELLINILLASY